MDGFDNIHISSTVVEKSLVLNISVLCQFFEYICASFIISHRLNRSGSLHDMTLNRRWISSLAETSMKQPRDTHLLRLFLQPLRALLHEVYYGSGTSGLLIISSVNFAMLIPFVIGYLVFERNNTKVDRQLRNIFVARMYVVFRLSFDLRFTHAARQLPQFMPT